QVEHEVLDDHPKPASADLPVERRFGNRLERIVGEPELDVLVLEQLHVLPRDGVTRLREDLDERGLVELVERADHRQPPPELRDEAVLDEVRRLELLERRPDIARANRLDVRLEPQGLLARPPLDLLVETHERTTADEEDVGRIDLEEFLVGMLAPTLRRDVRDRTFEDLQQRLLDALSRHVPSDRRVLVLAADLVDFVDVDDPLLALLDVAARRLQQLQNDVLDILADV